jgi:hypothetical protein
LTKNNVSQVYASFPPVETKHLKDTPNVSLRALRSNSCSETNMSRLKTV